MKPTYEQLDAQVRELTEQRDAALVENAGLKDVLDGISIYGRDTLSGPANAVENLSQWYRKGVREMTSRASVNMSATDAVIIATLRAEGVEMFAAFCRGKAEVRAYNFFSDAALNAEEYARQLRESKGVQS